MTDTAEQVVKREEIVRAVGAIEPMPVAAARLLSIVADDGFSVSEVVDVVRFDTALAGDVLFRANSAAYAARNPTGEISAGVARIGAAAVVQIAVARAVKGRLSTSLPVYGMAPKDLWRHSVIASVVAEGLVATVPGKVPSSAGTAALIHDVGKTVISSVVPNSFLEALRPAAESDNLELVDAEALVLGIDHAEVSALAARCWGMPVFTQIALARHHSGSGAESSLVTAVELSNELAYVVEGILDSVTSDSTDVDVDESLLVESLTPRMVDLLDQLGLDESVAPRLLIESSISSYELLGEFD